MYEYTHPHPAVTTDIVLFTVRDDRLQLLLVRRGIEPYRGSWALPGGFVRADEGLDTCARRELEEETGVGEVYLEQLYTFGKPDRDPRERVITVAYYALVCSSRLRLSAASDAVDARWFPVDNLPELAFDHEEIVELAHRRLVSKLDYATIAFQFLPNTFTLNEVQDVYETIGREPLDNRNFRKWILAFQLVEETGEVRRGGANRPAKLYRLSKPGTVDHFR
jgi:8-oxo-dGTP diphosphatase